MSDETNIEQTSEFESAVLEGLFMIAKAIEEGANKIAAAQAQGLNDIATVINERR